MVIIRRFPLHFVTKRQNLVISPINGNCTEYPTMGTPNDRNTQQKSWVFWSLGIPGKMTGIPNNGIPKDGIPNNGMSSD